MRDFITYDVRTSLPVERIYEIVAKQLPEFAWRQGDSDAQGPYISGTDSDAVQMKLWLGEDPMTISASFRAIRDLNKRQSRQIDLVDVLETVVLPGLGIVLKKNG